RRRFRSEGRGRRKREGGRRRVDPTGDRDDQLRCEGRRHRGRDGHVRTAGHLTTEAWAVARRARVAGVCVVSQVVPTSNERVERRAPGTAGEPARGSEGVAGERGGATLDEIGRAH